MPFDVTKQPNHQNFSAIAHVTRHASMVLFRYQGMINFQIETSTICCSRASEVALKVRHYIDLIVDIDFIMNSAVLRAAEKTP